jgi:RsiW-degrading membrane proteinase PrsW (M82 family)
MQILIILAAAFGPGLFWLWFIYRKDKFEPEPKKLVAKMFFWGLASAVPVCILEMPFMFSEYLSAVLAAPVIEELAKYWVVRTKVYKSVDFNEPMDGIVYSAAVALGFASIENLFYIVGGGDMVSTSIIRALLSVPGHALFSGMWGYALGIAKFREPQAQNKIIVQGLLLGIGMHALFNFLLSTSPYLALGVVILVPVLWKLLFKRIHTALSLSPFRDRDPNEPPTRPLV